MNLVTGKISTGKAVRFDDFIKKYQESKATVKTASVQEEVTKVAEEIEEVKEVKEVKEEAPCCENIKDEEDKAECEEECKEEEKEEAKEEAKEASKKSQFVKIANLDAKNKKFLTDYWRQIFGDDYVNALVADK